MKQSQHISICQTVSDNNIYLGNFSIEGVIIDNDMDLQ